jgi:predicted small lipoprotein YifL
MHCWARYLFIAIVTIMGVGSIVTACGQKGDLYLPDPAEKPDATPRQVDDVPSAPPAPPVDTAGQ